MSIIRIAGAQQEILSHKEQIADMLLDFSPSHHAAWPSREAAVQEVEESLGTDKPRISLLALHDDQPAGWIAGFLWYNCAFEVHPLVVRASMQRQGIGRALLQAFETRAAELGGLTVLLGTDDQNNATTLGGSELFPNVLDHVRTIRSLKSHPYAFYQRCGYEIVGVFPDVNGKGQPDIFMAKSLTSIGTAARQAPR